MLKNKLQMETLMSNWIKTGYKGLVLSENFVRHFLLLAIRLYWGVLLIMTGIGKWANIGSVASFFADLGIPAPYFSAYLAATFEFLGGVSLVVGLFSRIFSIFLIVIFAVAYATSHLESVHMLFNNPSLFISQDPFLYLYASLIVLCFGPGMFSFDYWIERKAYGKAL